jgi:midasin (ATPase involved in ribosome maturation)
MDGNNVGYFDRQDEQNFLIGANLAAYQVSIESKTAKWDASTYDFYHDPNIVEAQRLQPLFKGLKDRISELLQEWPDHPALQQVGCFYIMKNLQLLISLP